MYINVQATRVVFSLRSLRPLNLFLEIEGHFKESKGSLELVIGFFAFFIQKSEPAHSLHRVTRTLKLVEVFDEEVKLAQVSFVKKGFLPQT